MSNINVKQLKNLSTEELLDLEEKEKFIFAEAALNKYHLPIIANYGFLFSVVTDGEIVGLASFISKNKTSFLVGLWVLKDYRRKGLAQLLLSKAMIKLKENGSREVELTVKNDNEAAKALYKKTGFKVVRDLENFYGPQESRMLLRVNLLE